MSHFLGIGYPELNSIDQSYLANSSNQVCTVVYYIHEESDLGSNMILNIFSFFSCAWLSSPSTVEPIELSQNRKSHQFGTPDRLKQTIKVFECFGIVVEPRSDEKFYHGMHGMGVIATKQPLCTTAIQWYIKYGGSVLMHKEWRRC